jgi:protein-S-isoprenylcysteine O-methyltransferase Ste14
VLLAIWATPRMTVGHLLLATGMTLYVLIAMRYEERDLLARFGMTYARWRTP